MRATLYYNNNIQTQTQDIVRGEIVLPILRIIDVFEYDDKMIYVLSE